MTQEEKFVNYFLESAYLSMKMEDEAVYSRDELYNRYRYTLESLINEWVHEKLKFKEYTNV